MEQCINIHQAILLIHALYQQKLATQPDLAKQPFILSIDGRCASGKTTLANQLEKSISNCKVVHLDDFFLQPHQRTPKRYATPGQNIDDQRLIQEVIDPYLKGQEIVYRPFSCQKMALLDPIYIGHPSILILEGAYANNMLLKHYANLRIFIHVDSQTQIERIEKRNGKDRLQDFVSKWIPLEEQYFKTLAFSSFDLILDLSASSLDNQINHNQMR